jgi:hypothetical protein
MTTFNDGPAAGQKLNPRRPCLYLRVVQSPLDGKWDALDTVTDEPRPDETIYAYKATSDRPHGFACGSGHCSLIVSYAMVWPQPRDAEMRTRAAWVKWCEAQK